MKYTDSELAAMPNAELAKAVHSLQMAINTIEYMVEDMVDNGDDEQTLDAVNDFTVLLAKHIIAPSDPMCTGSDISARREFAVWCDEEWKLVLAGDNQPDRPRIVEITSDAACDNCGTSYAYDDIGTICTKCRRGSVRSLIDDRG